MFRATPESPRMFAQDALDVWTRFPFWGVPLLWVPLLTTLTWICWRAPEGWAWIAPAPLTGWGVSSLVFLGLLCWTFAEYALHRFVFHWVPPGRWGERLHFFAHGVHHTWPRDRYRLVMPPAVSLPLGVLFLAPARLLAGTSGTAWFVGFALGYVIYDLTHYAVHHAPWRAPWFQRLRGHHLRHHFQDDRKGFGVTSWVWDRVFGSCSRS
jgi:sterol desaturase/sphingolipid hydroxylase (fatty acid hydroxylase superfamily)